MNQTERIKKIAFIILLLSASGFFIYSGFTMLFNENEISAEQNSTLTPSN